MYNIINWQKDFKEELKCNAEVFYEVFLANGQHYVLAQNIAWTGENREVHIMFDAMIYPVQLFLAKTNGNMHATENKYKVLCQNIALNYKEQ